MSDDVVKEAEAGATGWGAWASRGAAVVAGVIVVASLATQGQIPWQAILRTSSVWQSGFMGLVVPLALAVMSWERRRGAAWCVVFACGLFVLGHVYYQAGGGRVFGQEARG